jgi:hypothetical protein
MNYYFERTQITPLARIRRVRQLPYPGELAVRSGQHVTPIQVIGRAEEPVDLQVLNLVDRLGISPGELTKHLAVESGEVVERGQVLWRKRSFWGRGRQVRSPIDGTFLGVSDNQLVLQPFANLIELRAMMPGQVVGITPGRSVTLECDATFIQALYSLGPDGFGRLKVVTPTADASLGASQLTADMRGLVLVAGHLEDPDLPAQAEELGVRGIIAGSVPNRLLQVSKATALTIMVTDGLGYQPMAAPIFKLLQQAQERDVSLFVQDPLDRGSRPEIIIALPTVGVAEPPAAPPSVLAVGQRVRLLREPYRSQMGEVVVLYDRPQVTAIEGQWPGVDVKLSGGEVVYVPCANLDLMC